VKKELISRILDDIGLESLTNQVEDKKLSEPGRRLGNYDQEKGEHGQENEHCRK